MCPPKMNITFASTANYASIVLPFTVVYVLGLAVLRLYLSTLAKYPGPRLAAFTIWYQS
jgi:hypothetical protein